MGRGRRGARSRLRAAAPRRHGVEGRLGRVRAAGDVRVVGRRVLAQPAHLGRGDRCSASCSASRWRSCWPAPSSGARRCCGRSCCCRSCCRPSSAASRCSTPSGAVACWVRPSTLSASTIAFSTTAVVLAQTFVALPFLVLSLEGALRTVGHALRGRRGDPRGSAHDRAAAGHPAARAARPRLGSRALVRAGPRRVRGDADLRGQSLQGVTRTLPLEIYLQRETDPDAAVALSLVLVLVAVVVVALAHQAGQSSGVATRRRGS